MTRKIRLNFKRVLPLLFLVFYVGTNVATVFAAADPAECTVTAQGTLCANQKAALKGGDEYVNLGQDISCSLGGSTATTPTVTSLTPAQEAAQTLMVGFDTSATATATTVVTDNKIGGVFFLSGGDPSAITQGYIASLNKAAGAKLFVAADDEGGQVSLFSKSTPSALAMGTTMTTAQIKAQGTAVGKTMSSAGLTGDLAPVLDIDHAGTPWHATERDYSSDPTKVAADAGAYADGLTAGGVTPVFKHFPGIGSVTSNTDNGATVSQSLASMTGPSLAPTAKDLLPYSKLAGGKDTGAIMLSNGFINEWGSTPVSINPKAVEYIRKTLKFTGAITTDALNALGSNYGSSNTQDIPSAVVKALNAGVDMPLFVAPSGKEDQTVKDTITAIVAGVDPTKIHAAYLNSLKLRGIASAAATNGTTTATDAAVGTGTGSQAVLDGFKLPAYSGQTGREEAINAAGQVPSTGHPVSFAKYAALGQPYQDYYINMRWTFSSWDWQGHNNIVDKSQVDWFTNGSKPRLLVVTNPKTGKSIIADAVETGPGPSVGTTWRAQHGNSSSVTAPYWPGFQTGTPAQYDGLVAGMPPTAYQALGMTDADVDAGYRSGGSTPVVPLQYAWATDQTATPGPTTTASAGGSSTATATNASSSACCATTATAASTTLSGGDNVEKVYNYLIGKGLTVFQAAGIMGNFHVESGFVPNVQEHGKSFPLGGWGLAQWTQSPGRRADMVAWLQKDPTIGAKFASLYVDGAPTLSPADNDLLLTSELNFFWNELQTSEQGSYQAVKAIATDTVIGGKSAAAQVALAYEETNERCATDAAGAYANCGQTERDIFADTVYKAHMDTASTITATPQDTNVTPGGSASTIAAVNASLTGGTCASASSAGANATGFTAKVLAYTYPTYHAPVFDVDNVAYKASWASAPAGSYSGAAGQNSGDPGVDCGGFVTRLMIDSGFEPNYNYSGLESKGASATPAQYAWLKANWQDLGAGGSPGADAAKLQPGDVAITRVSGHTFVYVGPGVFADSANGKVLLASASLGERAPMADSQQRINDSNFEWFRKTTKV